MEWCIGYIKGEGENGGFCNIEKRCLRDINRCFCFYQIILYITQVYLY